MANQRLEDLFQTALDLDRTERARFLDQQCEGDSALLAELRSLLESDSEAESARFWKSSALEAEAIRTALEPDARIGQSIGSYKIVDVISSGGMGTVYRAVRDDAEYQMHVAVKVIKRGMDTDVLVRRFRAERQILAQLEHPNIARLLDGGSTTDGLPYLVMEYVDGQPIDEYVDSHVLSLPQRLQLFRTVCSAVQYAHQNLVVHRDLKPSNILVTAQGVPKLLDFGIAKILSPDQSGGGDQTLAALAFMTPEYASPEQVRAESITTVSDVYSLGVLLYRLLTGRSPYRFKTRQPEEIAKTICFQDPEKPSAALARLRGDLDNIVLMAIRKEPARRYASVELFSEDIRRHLSGLPVIAHRDTPGYRIGKFAQRHRAGVAAGVLLTLSLAVGLLGTIWQAHVAQIERERAERRFNDVRKLANSFLFEFHDAIENIPGTLAARQLILKRALEYLDGLSGEAGNDRALKSELAAAYDRVGTLTWNVAASLAAHRKALAINASLVQSEPRNPKYRAQLADSYASAGDALRDANDSAGSLESHRQSMLIRRSLLESDPGNPDYQTLLADTYERMGIILEQTGRTDEALAWQMKASPLLQAALKAAPSNIDNRRAAMNNRLFIARVEEDQGDFKAALENCNVARETADALNARDPSNVTYRRDLWVNDLRVAGLLSKKGDPKAALVKYQSALQYIEKLSNADPGDKGHRRGLAVTYLAIGDALPDRHQAAASYTKAIAISQALLAADPNKGETMVDLANMHAHLGILMHNPDSLAKSRALFEEAIRRDPTNARYRREQAAALAKSQ